MSKSKVLPIVDLSIDSLSKNGYGIGQYARSDGTSWPVEVPFAMPGDKVRVKLLRKRAGVFACLLEEIIEPSPNRIKPVCVHFGTCGGCRWQHIPYEMQLEIKEELVRKSLSPYANEATVFHPIIPSTPPWNYRNKMEFTFSSDAAKKKYLGLNMHSGRGRAINLTECHLVDHWFLDALKATKQWWEESNLDSYNLHRDTGSLRTLTVREGVRTGDRMVILTLSGNPEFALNKTQTSHFVEAMRKSIEPTHPDSKLSVFFRIQQIAKGIPTNFYEIQLYGPEYVREILQITGSDEEIPQSLMFNISPMAFFQPNTRQAEKLYSIGIKLAEISPGSVVYDLYCGTGTIGICVAKKSKQVIGIEISRQAVLDARENVKVNQLENVTIFEGDVGQLLVKNQQENLFPKPDVVIVDPPRSGLGTEAVNQVLKLKPLKILYLSCNPATQSTDLALMTANGYRMHVVQPVDQFPHTIHVENIVVLQRIA